MTEKTQQGIKSKKSTPMGRVSPVTPATLGPAEGMVSPTDENVVKHQLRESPTQSASGLPAPTRDEPSDPSSEDDQRSPKLKGVSLPGESVKSKDDALAEVDQVPGSSAYPTAPSSPRDSDLVKNLEELELNGNSETQDGPALNERPGSPDSSVTSSRPSLDEADTPSSPALAVDGHTVPHGETEEVVTEEEEHPVLPVTAIVPAPQADELTVLALDVASEEPRNAESEQSTESEQSGDEDDQGHDPAVQASESEDDEDEDQRAVLPALADAGHDLAEPLEGRHSQPTGIRRAPRSYFYSTTATYEDISRNPARDTHYCIANKPNSEQCRNRRTDPHADICPAHSLFLRGHLFRRELPQFHEHVDYEDLVYHAANQEDFVIASTPEFEAFTDDFHPLIKQNIYFLIRDYLLVLGWKVDREDILEESSSALARKYRKDDDDLTSRIGCERVGRVYMLVPSPRPIDRDRMWFAGDRVRDAQDSLPVKIGQSEDVARRFRQHQGCGMQTRPSVILPAIKYVELLERILHEVFVAHQHDLLCRCGGVADNRGTNHIEVFWFERISGGENLQEDFEGIVEALRGDIVRCQEFVKLLSSRLSLYHS